MAKSKSQVSGIVGLFFFGSGFLVPVKYLMVKFNISRKVRKVKWRPRWPPFLSFHQKTALLVTSCAR